MLVATSRPDASLPRKLDRVSSEIRDAEAVQRFAGAVDPAGGAAMAKEPPSSAIDKLVDSRARIAAIDPKDPRVDELSTAIGEAAANEAYADSLKVRLDLVGAARDSNDIVRRGLQTNDLKIKVIDATIAAQDKLMADLRDELAETGVMPKLSTASLEFGIVDCKRPVAQPGVSR